MEDILFPGEERTYEIDYDFNYFSDFEEFFIFIQVSGSILEQDSKGIFKV